MSEVGNSEDRFSYYEAHLHSASHLELSYESDPRNLGQVLSKYIRHSFVLNVSHQDCVKFELRCSCDKIAL